MIRSKSWRLIIFACAFFIAIGIAFSGQKRTEAAVTAPLPSPNCTSPAQNAIDLAGTFPATPQPGMQLTVLVFPRQHYGDVYLQNLAYVAGNSPPLPSGPGAVGAIAQRMQDLQDLKMNLSALFATMDTATLNANGAFACSGLVAGQWTIFVLEQAIVGSPPPKPTTRPAGSIYQANAASNYLNARPITAQTPPPVAKKYFAYATIASANSNTQQSSTNRSRANSYQSGVVAPFLPIQYFPDGYFGAPFSVPTPASAEF